MCPKLMKNKTLLGVSIPLGVLAGAFILYFSAFSASKPMSTAPDTPRQTTSPSASTASGDSGSTAPSQKEPATFQGTPGNSSALVFALTNSADPKLSVVLAAPGIDGVALQESWNQLEPIHGTYYWTRLDAALLLAKQNGKKATLHILASPHTPSWLAGLGAQYFSGTDIRGRSISDVVPWDGIYLKEYATFLNALSAHLSSVGLMATVFDVSVVVPTSEMNLVACQNNSLSSDIPYDRAKYLTAWEQTGDAIATAFPSAYKFVSPPVHDQICLPSQDASFYPDIMNYFSQKYGHTFLMFAADLTAEGSQRAENHLNLVPESGLGFQTIWSATNDPSHRMLGTYPDNLRQAVCKGKNDGGTYFEIYAADVENANPAIQKGISAVHDASLCK